MIDPRLIPFLPLMGVVIGFLLAQGAASLERKRRRKAHLGALHAEIRICERMATTYRQDPVAAPLYRLPTAAFGAAFPKLLADGVLTESQVENLESFAAYVEDINRGLDNAHRAVENGDDTALAREANRLRVKCHKFVEPHEGQDAYVQRARRAVVGV